MLQNIPEELQNLKQWVCAYQNSKVPMMATSPNAASSTNSQTWCTFRESLMSVKCGNYDNLGFVFNGNGIVGIDIDIAYDDDGFLTEMASDIIGRCKSYTEKSRSGRGFHILVKGALPFKGKNNLSGVEIYQSSRYFIMTGNVFMYKNLVENQEAIDYILDKYFPETVKESNNQPFSNRIYTPKWMKNGDKIKLRPTYPKIADGCRNISLTSLAGTLHSQGYTPRQIYNELVYCNKVACKPLLHDNEIQTIVSSVTRYKR